MPSLIDCARLRELVKEPNLADAGLNDVTFIGLDLRDESFSEQDTITIKHWLATQPVPVVGLANEGTNLSGGLDLLVTSETDCDALIDRIIENPMATSVLVQVTRVTASLPTTTALIVESLGYATLQSGAEFHRWLAGFKDNGRRLKEVSEPVLLERSGTELFVTLNSPENRNALSVPMRDALTNAFKLVAMDETIEKAVVSGNGPCFSAGGDLTEFGEARDLAEAHHIRQLRMPAQYLAPHAGRYTFRLHGACIGAGIELPAFAGHISATSDTFFQLPEVGMGLIPGAGGCVSIPRRIGRQRTNYLAISGEKLPAEEALAWGLIDEIVE